MTTFANALAIACFLAAFFRARWVALALLPTVALILASWMGLVDLSSASHPARWIVPAMVALGAGVAAWWYGQTRFYDVVVGKLRLESGTSIAPNRRATIASILVLGSCAPDLLALHPFFWARFATWPLVPVQIAVCATILAVLFAPERWISKCLR